jgi:hypothetical protein
VKRLLEIVVEKRDVVVRDANGKAKSEEGGSNYIPAVKFSTLAGTVSFGTESSHFTPFISASKMS